MKTKKNWIASFYDENDEIIETIKLKNLTEYDALIVCDVHYVPGVFDWSLVDESIFDDKF